MARRKPHRLITRRIKKNPRNKRVPHWDDCDVHVWEERDRLHIELRNRNNDKTVAEWWDDDAQQMFEDGLFDSRDLEYSVKRYAKEMGWIQR